MSQSLSFEAKNKALKDVLFANRKYRVPRYQRPYAWGIDQISELWDDLTTSNEPYFLGSLIFNTETEEEDGYVDIIDGQQRLLSLTILSAVIRDVARKIDKTRADLIQRKDIGIEDSEGQQTYRVLPSETLANYFQKNVQNESGNIYSSQPKSKEEHRVRENYIFLHEKLTAHVRPLTSKEAQLEEINKLRRKISKLIVIGVELTREEDAYEIFETTNARGLDLSVGDLLKNLIFKKIPNGSKRDSAKDAWLEIIGNVESTNTEIKKFIRYFWISKHAFLSEKSLYREIKNKTTDWQKLLNDLVSESATYSLLHVGTEQDFQELKHGSEIHKAIFSLRIMRVSQCFVLIMSILRNIKKIGTDPLRVFKLIENFTFQYSAVCKQPGNRVEKIYSRYAIRLEKLVSEASPKTLPGKVQSLFADLEKDLLDAAPKKDLFVTSFSELAYKNTEECRKLIKYTLSKINEKLCQTDEHLINYTTVNIEHILPQKPAKEWKLNRKEIKPYVNLLGNLTLLSKKINSTIQNSIIEKKLPELEKSDLPVTKEVVKVVYSHGAAWGRTQILERQAALAERAYHEIWDLNA